MSDLATALQVKATTGNGETAEHKLEASRLFFLAEFLEARIVPKRIEHWIEPEEPPIFLQHRTLQRTSEQSGLLTHSATHESWNSSNKMPFSLSNGSLT
jgi:hypothetical protein